MKHVHTYVGPLSCNFYRAISEYLDLCTQPKRTQDDPLYLPCPTSIDDTEELPQYCINHHKFKEKSCRDFVKYKESKVNQNLRQLMTTNGNEVDLLLAMISCIDQDQRSFLVTLACHH